MCLPSRADKFSQDKSPLDKAASDSGDAYKTWAGQQSYLGCLKTIEINTFVICLTVLFA